MIGIVDYKVGNLASVHNAFAKLGVEAKLVQSHEEIMGCDKLILPGVGAFGDAMNHLRQYNLVESLADFAQSGKYLLGICLGMQLLFERSEEFGSQEGLGLIEGEVVYFDSAKTQGLKIPHVGWNQATLKPSPLFDGIASEPYLYFVHSLHVKCDEKFIIGSTTYGEAFPSIINKDNIYGIQPHPEKSHNNGLKILENFSKL